MKYEHTHYALVYSMAVKLNKPTSNQLSTAKCLATACRLLNTVEDCP